MAAQTVRFLLHRARDAHDQLSGLYLRMEERAPDIRAHMLLAYLTEHEATLRDSIKEIEASTQPNVLETWLAFPPDEQQWRLFDAHKARPTMTFEEVFDLALEIDDALIHVYERLKEAGATDDVSALFSSLWEQAQGERNRLAWEVPRMD